MRKLKFIWIVLSALMLAGACSRLDEQKAALNIYVRLPEDAATKASYTDWSTLFSRETRINDLKIWVFLNESTDASLPAGLLLGYLEPKQLNVVSGSVQKFTVLLDKEVASKIKKVDVYVLANNGSFQIAAIGRDTPSTDLDAIVLTDNQFGVAVNGTPTNTGVIDYQGLPSKDDIVGNTNPSSYVFDSLNETPQEYQARIYEALVNNTLTGYAPCYLRESDKALTGKINYTLGTFAPKTLDFSMNPNEKFTRNSSWVLYFYINNNSLSLSVAYLPWTPVDSYTIIGR